MIRLVTTYYNELNNKRSLELINALSINLSLQSIAEVIILNEGGNLSQFNSVKLQVVPIKKRPSFKDFFDYINVVTEKHDINIISNTDISFDENIGLLEYLNLDNKCLALSRWEIHKNKTVELLNRNDSQDTWIFKGEIKAVNSDFPIGVPRCDNRILFELKKAGYKVLNPAYSIKTYHHHSGNRNDYSTSNLDYFIEPPYAFLYPHNLFNLFITLWFNMLHVSKTETYKYDTKKINRWFLVRIFRKGYALVFRKEFPLIGYR